MEKVDTINYHGIQFKYSHSSGDTSGEGCVTEIVDNDEYELYKYTGNEGKCFIDIGGNHGLATLIMAILNPKSKVFVLEPIPELARRIIKNVLINNLANVTVINKALGDGNDVKLVISNQYSGASSTIVTNDESFSGMYQGSSEINVETLTFDDIVKTYVPGNDIELLKIDCEGGEYYLYDSEIFKTKNVKNLAGEFHNLSYNLNRDSNWNYDDLTAYVKSNVDGDVKVSYLTL